MKPKRIPSQLEQKARREAVEYPVATIAYYGPDNQFASKVVVCIILNEKDEEIADCKKWFSISADVRLDQAIHQEIVKYIQSHNVKRVTMSERIIGCPHEEGIDYPEGGTCPYCPFWENRNR